MTAARRIACLTGWQLERIRRCEVAANRLRDYVLFVEFDSRLCLTAVRTEKFGVGHRRHQRPRQSEWLRLRNPIYGEYAGFHAMRSNAFSWSSRARLFSL